MVVINPRLDAAGNAPGGAAGRHERAASAAPLPLGTEVFSGSAWNCGSIAWLGVSTEIGRRDIAAASQQTLALRGDGFF